MKKIKIVSMIVAFVILVTSCNFAMMFTSNAKDVSTIDGIRNAVSSISEGGTIKLTKDINATDLAAIEPIDCNGKAFIFDGNEHLITNLKIKGGSLFTNVGDGSSFVDLGMYDCYITDFAANSKEGYGFLADDLTMATVTNCFVDGTITVYGSPEYVGGFAGSFNGTMTNSYTMVDIYTDGSYVGGLVGKYTGTDGQINGCYSTGSIDNGSREFIGGLIGYSGIPCVTNSYTTVCILNPYADTVKSIGVINGLSEEHNVYYDENLSLQKQGDMDPHRCSPSELSDKFRNSESWIIVDPITDENGNMGEGCYPQLAVFYNSDKESYKRISAISSAVVNINRDDGMTTGREFTIVSSGSSYSYATLTNNIDNTGSKENSFKWNISGGIDEYYFDPATSASIPTNSGSTLNGLSGNTFDSRTGKYLFVNTGDIKFTASSDVYERDIYVHVTTYDKHPYFVESKVANIGTGTESDPFLINSLEDLDMIRLYCVDDEDGRYSYKLSFTRNSNSAYVVDMSTINPWKPIVGMKGNFLGNGHIISNLTVTSANEGGAGLFASISNTCLIQDLHISEATVSANIGDCAGVLAGSVKNAHLEGVMVTGIITGPTNGGMLAGEAYGTSMSDKCLTMGIVSAAENAGGVFGYSGGTDDNVTVSDSYSCAVVKDAKFVGGLIGAGSADIQNSIFTGNVSPGLDGHKYGLTGGNGTVTNSYFDWQAAGIHNSDDPAAKATTDLVTGGTIALGDNWHWFASGTSGAPNYPQLKYFTNKKTSTQYYGGRTARTSFMAAVALTYTDGTAPGSSICFTKATYNRRYENGVARHVNFPVVYGENINGYTIPTAIGQAVNQVYTITATDGGRQVYKLGYQHTSYPGDVRYVLFNIKNVKIHYTFAYKTSEEMLAYNSDMNNNGLCYITNELGSQYNAILDSDTNGTYSSKIISISPAGDTLSFELIDTIKYNYSMEAYADSKEEASVLVQENNLISIATLDEVYVKFIIEEDDLPWGIYRLNGS